MLLGSSLYVTSSAQLLSSVNLGSAAALSVAAGDRLVATATDADGNTSEFSASVNVVMPQFLAWLNGAQEAPPVDTPSTGLGRFAFNTAHTELAFILAVELGALSGPVTAAHFHGPAPIGANAGIVRTICANQVDCASAFTGGTAEGTWLATDPEAMTSSLVDALLAGNLYVNVHMSAHSGGEIRGQIERLICGDLNRDRVVRWTFRTWPFGKYRPNRLSQPVSLRLDVVSV